MTDTTQPHPEPSEEASSLPVVGYAIRESDQFMWAPPVSRPFAKAWRAVVYEADAQSKLNAMRAELERKSDAIQKLWKERDEARTELAALKAAQVAPAAGGVVEDTERLDWLDSTPAVNVDDMSMREWLWKRPAGVGNIRDAIDAAREALRAALASPEGSPR